MEIRDLTESDLPACAALFASAFSAPPWNEHWSPPAVEARLREIHQTPGSLGLIATDNDHPLAFLTGYAETWGPTRHFYLKEMCVHPHHQRSGIGSALMSALSTRLIQSGVTKLYLLTTRDGPAQAFYAKHGLYTSPKMILMAKHLT
jgi:ribosomal protein S18 acetylase RimI-like enzyme